jgi:PAS domain S-box-containing protein
MTTEVPALVADPIRLESLGQYDILDTATEIGFDDIVMLARRLCHTPIALVSLVAEKRQWFKAVSGLDVCETPIEQSVCAHALAQGSTLNIPDLAEDPRTRDNTLVTGDPFIRFYAGALLQTPNGDLLGTVCVIDTVPRPGGLTPLQIESLEALARQVMIQLELRRAKIEADALGAEQRINETRLRLAQEAGQIGSFEVDIPTDRLTVSEQFCRVYGLPYQPQTRPEAVEALVYPEDRSEISTRARRQHSDMPLIVEYRIRRGDTGATAWISRRAQFEFDAAGAPVRMLGTVHDITDRKHAEEQLKLANIELGHRMKNTMTLVQAIASQTLRRAEDRGAVDAFTQRIAALSRAQDMLVHQSWVSVHMRDIVTGALVAHGDNRQFVLNGPEVDLDPKAALSLSLLLHELATNAVKYGALSFPRGQVAVTWSSNGTRLSLRWVESGGPVVQPPERKGLGTRLIDMGLLGTGEVEKSYDPAGFRVEFHAAVALIEYGGDGGTLG